MWNTKKETAAPEPRLRRVLRRVVVRELNMAIDLHFDDATSVAALSDISGGGCCLHILFSPFEETKVPAVGTSVTVALPLAAQPLSCPGRVVAVVTDGGVGYVEVHIRFQKLTMVQHAHLQAWLVWLTRQRYPMRHR